MFRSGVGVMSMVLCVDVGSTWTKGALIGPDGELVGVAQRRTAAPEVLRAVDAIGAALEADGTEVLACSSAGGGLRLAVVGQERLISSEAGYRVALSAGARVVHVSAGPLDAAGMAALRAAEPDVVLLVGGTDGGDTRALLHNAERLAGDRLPCPVVLAGNTAARQRALDILAPACTVVPADNVLPDVGELAPRPARQAIRKVFLHHVIGGKGLSADSRFHRMVRAVTPDAVLAGVSRLAAVRGPRTPSGAVVVVDVGGATTDVYSVSAEQAGVRRSVDLPVDRRTVEGDLGVRWSAPGVVAEAEAERLISEDEARRLRVAAEHRAGHIGWTPESPGDAAADARLATLAAIIALRRHFRLVSGRLGPKGAAALVLSGGVFRHGDGEMLAEVVRRMRDDPALRPELREAAITVDANYVLAPAGLLTEAGRAAEAGALLAAHLPV